MATILPLEEHHLMLLPLRFQWNLQFGLPFRVQCKSILFSVRQNSCIIFPVFMTIPDQDADFFSAKSYSYTRAGKNKNRFLRMPKIHPTTIYQIFMIRIYSFDKLLLSGHLFRLLPIMISFPAGFFGCVGSVRNADAHNLRNAGDLPVCEKDNLPTCLLL